MGHSWSLSVGPHRFMVGYARTERILGITSRLDNGPHVLMWDFDGVDLVDVETAIRYVQEILHVGTVHVFTSGQPQHFHAYALYRFDWPFVIRVLAITPFVDTAWFKFSVMRDYCTLRFSDKDDRAISFIESLEAADYHLKPVHPSELKLVVYYTTDARNHGRE